MQIFRPIFITLAIVLISNIALAQSTTKHYVFLKNPAGLLTGVIVHNNTLASSIKVNAFCAVEYLRSNTTCEAVDESSPFASDPNKALRFVNNNPNLSQEVFNKIISDLTNVSAQLSSLNTPPRPTTINLPPPTVSDAAVPEQLEGTDRNSVAISTGDTTPAPPTPPQPTIAPQFNVQPLPDIAGLVNDAVARAVGSLSLSAPAPTPVTPNQVISSFFSGTQTGSQYIGYGAGELQSPNSNANFKALSLGDGLTAGYAVLGSSTVGTLNAAAALVTNSTVTNLTTTNFNAQGATFTNIYVSGAFSTASGTFTVVATTSNFSDLNATNISASTTQTDNLTATAGTFTRATSTNFFSSVLNALTAFIGTLTTNTIQTGSITATGSSYALASFASTSNATTTNANTGNIGTLNAGTGNFTTVFATGTSQFATSFSSTSRATTSLASTSYVTNLTVAGSSTLSSTTVTNLTATGDIAGNDLALNGTATLATITAASITSARVEAQSLWANILTALSASLTSMFASTAYVTTLNATTTNASTSNVGTLNATAAVLGAATLTSATVTNSFATNQNVTNASVTNLTVGGNDVTTLVSNIATTLNTQTVNSSTSNATTSNATTGNIGKLNAGTGNFTTVIATGTSQFTTVLASTSLASTSYASTSFVTNLTVAGSSTLASTTVTNLTATGDVAAANVNVAGTTTSVGGSFTFANILSAVIGTLFGTTANFQTLNASTTNASTSNVATLNVSATTTSTGLSATYAAITQAIIGTLFGTSAQFTTLSASTTNASTSNADVGNFGTLNAGTGNFTTVFATGTSQFATVLASTSRASTSLASTSYVTDLFATNATFTNISAGNLSANLTNGYIWRGNSANLSEATSTLYIADTGLIGLKTLTPTANLSINQGTLTGGAQGGIQLNGTWNNAGSIYKGIEVDITNTNSHSNSNLFNLALAGASVFKVNSQGNTLMTGTLGVTGTTTLNSPLDMSSQRIQNLAIPVSNTDAVNKAYVDNAFASGVLWQSPVKTISTTTAPGAPATGDRYLIQAGQSGFGSCNDDDIAEWTGAAWTCFTPATGTTVFVDSTINQQYNYNGSAWVSIAQAIDHNSLYNLQGGTTGEYYHLNAAQYSALNNINAQLSQLQTTGTATQFVNLTLTGGLNITGTNGATITNATFTNAYITNVASATQFYGSNSVIANSTSTNTFATNASLTNASTTNLFAAVLTVLVSSFTNLIASSATITNATTTTLNTTSLLASNSTSTYGYFTSLLTAFAANVGTLFAQTGYVTTLYATTTNATTTNTQNLIVTGSSTLGSTTLADLTAGTGAFASVVAGTATLTSATATNLYVSGTLTTVSPASFEATTTFSTTTAASSTITNLNVTTGSIANLSATNSILGNATATSIYSASASASALIANFATFTAATSTSLYANLFNALSSVLTNLIATSATTTNSTTTYQYVSNYFNTAAGNITALTSTNATLTNATSTHLNVSGKLTLPGLGTNVSGTSVVTVDSTGALATTSVTSVGTEGLLVYSAGSQSVPNNTVTTLTDLTNVTRNDFGVSALSGGAFTVPAGKEGWYQIAGQYVQNIGNSSENFIEITVNNVTVAQQMDANGAAGNGTFVSVTSNLHLKAGDVVRMNGLHNSGAARTTNALTHLSLVRLASTATSVHFGGLQSASSTNTLDNTNLAQTWNWSTGTTENLLNLSANALTTGSLFYASSTATGVTGSLGIFELTGNNAGVTGNALRVGITGASAAGTALNITNAGTGFAMRVNDDGSYTDTTPFVIDASGNVGIGTDAPTNLLHVNGTALISGILTMGNNIALGSTNGLTWDSNSESVLRPGTDALAFSTQSTEHMRIDANGRVGIGTNSPVDKLEVSDSATHSVIIRKTTEAVGNAANLYFLTGTGALSNSNLIAGVEAYITDANPSALKGELSFRVNGGDNTSERMRITSTGAIRLGFYGAGTLQTDASGNVTASSDERLKDILGLYATTSLEQILGINPIVYKWNATSGLETEHSYVGFSAQNVQANIPEAVATDTRGYLTLSDRGILATLVNALKEIGNISGTFRKNLIAWLGSLDNGLTKVRTDSVQTSSVQSDEVNTDKVCIGSTCVTEDQLKEMLLKSGSTPLNQNVLTPNGTTTTGTTTSPGATGSTGSSTPLTTDTGSGDSGPTPPGDPTPQPASSGEGGSDPTNTPPSEPTTPAPTE